MAVANVGDAAEEYAPYCRHVAGLIEQHAERPAGTLLDIGCGGGKNVFNLKGRFSVTGVDLSPTMLAQASDLNPESTFVHGDMRTFRLGTTFDAVLMDNAISYMTCLADFVAAFRTASAHLNPGGVLIATADVTTETFRQNKTIATPATRTGTRDELDVVFVENVYDPNPRMNSMKRQSFISSATMGTFGLRRTIGQWASSLSTLGGVFCAKPVSRCIRDGKTQARMGTRCSPA